MIFPTMLLWATLVQPNVTVLKFDKPIPFWNDDNTISMRMKFVRQTDGRIFAYTYDCLNSGDDPRKKEWRFGWVKVGVIP